jgi:ABC-2 type transport system ATP-binding protein
MNFIEVNNLTRDYGNGKGVFNVSFSLEQGEAFGFLGPNGAGKTTTIRHLMGFLRPKSGSCIINNLDCWRNSAEIQKRLGYIPGEISFFDDMTGIEYLRFLLRYRGMKSEVKMNGLLDRFELDARGRIKKMSKGMKQKTGIVAAFMHDPEILILDEPTSGLDPLMRNRFIELTHEEKSRGKTILMSSHMFEEVERTCHRVGIIKNGRLAAVDSIETLKAAQVRNYTVTLETEDEAAAFAKEPLTVSEVYRNRVTVSVQSDMRGFIAAMNRHAVTDLASPEQSLEDIFMQYYGNGGGDNV